MPVQLEQTSTLLFLLHDRVLAHSILQRFAQIPQSAELMSARARIAARTSGLFVWCPWSIPDGEIGVLEERIGNIVRQVMLDIGAAEKR